MVYTSRGCENLKTLAFEPGKLEHSSRCLARGYAVGASTSREELHVLGRAGRAHSQPLDVWVYSEGECKPMRGFSRRFRPTSGSGYVNTLKSS